ncbi:hypothetical protein WDW37_13690 [Bdellovibrionota bacterium FG-1]
MNSPVRLGAGFSPRFADLPLQSMVPVEHMPWADTYWPADRGGIAYRWNSKDPAFAWTDPHLRASDAIFHYHSPNKVEAMRMSRYELSQLSPTEKFDLVRGEYDYPLTRQVLKHTGPLRAYWEGICHGWAPASVNHAEPLPSDVVNRDGIVIPFGSADVKAILDYYYGTQNMRVRQMGKRCKVDLTKNPQSTDPDCLDVNAGAFHIVLANSIGRTGRPIVADVSRGNEVWNNPIYSYSSKIVQQTVGAAPGSAKNTVRRVLLETEVRFASDDERLPPQWEATVGQEQLEIPADGAVFNIEDYATKYRYEAVQYKYWLELDGADNIIGGEWASADRPDYIWSKAPMAFEGDFAALNWVYRPMFK